LNRTVFKFVTCTQRDGNNQILIINTYVSLMYELKKKWKGTDE